MKIIRPWTDSGWVQGISHGRLVDAKVYQLPSTFGVFDGHVSKIAIYKGTKRDPHSAWHEQLDYHYDRGLDFDDLKDDVLLKAIVDDIEHTLIHHKFGLEKDLFEI